MNNDVILKDDITLKIKYEGQKEIVINTSYIQEDIIRIMCGLKPHEQD